jgi:hypothetical protein
MTPQERWLSLPPKEALVLQRPLPDGALRIVAGRWARSVTSWQHRTGPAHRRGGTVQALSMGAREDPLGLVSLPLKAIFVELGTKSPTHY